MASPLFYSILTSLFAFASTIVAEPLHAKPLTEIAARHGVPMPPKEARLVLAHGETWINLTVPSTSREPAIYSPAFLLEEKADGSVIILRGMEYRTVAKRYKKEPLWRAFSLEHVEPRVGGYAVNFEDPSAFVCAVQLAARGDDARAQALWQRFAQGLWRNFAEARLYGVTELDDKIERQRKNPALLLGQCSIDHQEYRLLEEPENWRDIHVRMKALLDEFPLLKDARTSGLFDDLTTTLQAKAPAPDSSEALLLHWAKQPSTTRHFWIFQERELSQGDAPAREIVLRGFDAVSDLIVLLDDQRITVHYGINSMKFPARVGDLANRLLQEITGMEALSSNTPRGFAAWHAWWKQTGGQREEDYYAKMVFLRKADQIFGVRESAARILAHKFPEKLPALCEEFSKHAVPRAQPFALARAVVASGLPKEIRVKVLSEFAQRGALEHQRCVLQNLAKLDRKKCAEIVKPVLERIPHDSEGPYWFCPEARFTLVVIELQDDDIWRQYLRLAKRCRVGLRLEIMSGMNHPPIRNWNRDRRLAFLAEFLDDETIRDRSADPGKFTGPHAAARIPKIAVRDFAAMQIAWTLDFDESPDEFWDSDQWSKLREKVRAGLAAERLPKLESARWCPCSCFAKSPDP